MNARRSLSLSFVALALLGAAVVTVPATRLPAASANLQDPQKPARDVSQFNLGKNQLALAGFDPVAYSPDGGGQALKGLAEIEFVHAGVRYYFASERNRELFKKQPAEYEPRYGGWCAYAMAAGEKVEIDPKSFQVQDGKLFLFYKSFVNDTRRKWLKDAAELERKADSAWAQILRKK